MPIVVASASLSNARVEPCFWTRSAICPWYFRARCLRVLQDQSFERVGGNETIQTDVRLIAATNRDLVSLIPQGRFRADLFYRLSVFTIRLPPLRDRLEDLPLLVDSYLRRFNRELGTNVTEVAPEAMALLSSYSWPGNIRELQSVLKQTMLLGKGRTLLPAFLPEHILNRVKEKQLPQDPLESFIRDRLKSGSEKVFEESLSFLEQRLLPEVLSHVRGSQVRAARILGVTRRTLRTKLRKLAPSLCIAEETAPLECGAGSLKAS